MHWRTYDRLCRVHDAAEERSTIGLDGLCEAIGPTNIPPRLKLK
jgi:hypothetical protein